MQHLIVEENENRKRNPSDVFIDNQYFGLYYRRASRVRNSVNPSQL